MEFEINLGEQPELPTVALEGIEIGHRVVRSLGGAVLTNHGQPIRTNLDWHVGSHPAVLSRTVGPRDAVAAGQIDAEDLPLNDLKIRVPKADLMSREDDIAPFAATDDGVRVLEFMHFWRSVTVSRNRNLKSVAGS